MSKQLRSKYFYPEGDGVWVLKQDLEVYIAPFASVKMKEGHRTNFASIPTWPDWLKRLPLVGWIFKLLDPQRLINPDDDTISIPAAIHDGLVGEFSPMVAVTLKPPGVLKQSTYPTGLDQLT